MVLCKSGVVFGGFTPALIRIIQVLLELQEAEPELKFVITSASDGQHMDNSKHYTFEALDVRSKTFPPDKKQEIYKRLKVMLGVKFTVLLEHLGQPNEHYHIQAKRGIRSPRN